MTKNELEQCKKKECLKDVLFRIIHFQKDKVAQKKYYLLTCTINSVFIEEYGIQSKTAKT